jgi:O-antigen ligase
MSALTLRRLEPAVPIIAAALLGVAVVQLSYRTNPIVPLALAAAAALLVLSVMRPMVTLYAAVALAPLELLSFQLGGAGISPAEAVLALSGGGWAVSRLVQGEAPFAPSPLGWPLGLMVLSLVPGIAIVTDPFTVIKVLVLWSAFFLVYQMIALEGTRDTVQSLLFVLAVSGAVVGAIAVIKSGGSAPQLVGGGEEAIGRASGSFGHPNTLATFEGLALPGALALGLKGPALVRPIALVSFGVIFAGLALSLSRGGLLAVAGALVMMLAWAPFRRTALVAGVVIVVVALAGANPLGETQQAQVLSQRLESVTYSAGGVDPRFRLWEVTPQIIADHPVIGVGENAFPEVALRYGLLLGTSGSTYEHAHNIPLTIAAELGLVGLAVFLWLLVALVRVLLRAYRVAPAERGFVLAVAAAFVALALQGLVDYTLRSAIIVGVIFALAGCATVLARGDEHARAPGVPG